METTHIHTTMKPEDYATARMQLRADLLRKMAVDVSLFLVLAALMAGTLFFVVPSGNADRVKLVVFLPLMLLALGVGWSVAQSAYLSVHGNRRIRELESRTLGGEAVSCEEFEKPMPVRLPSWLKS